MSLEDGECKDSLLRQIAHRKKIIYGFGKEDKALSEKNLESRRSKTYSNLRCFFI
jgi:hypothetical protein